MKIIDIDIHNIRGIRDLVLHPSGKNLVIYGPNGTGKSAIVDAIDFLLTGNISRLCGKGTAGITLKQHGRHLEVKPIDAYVRAKVNIQGQEFEIYRNMANEKDLVCPDEFRPQIDKVIQLAKLGNHILTRREILRFITSEGSERAKEIQALLNIKDVDEIRKAINTAGTSLEGKVKQKKKDVDRDKATVCAALGIFEYDESTVLSFINGWRTCLGGSNIGMENLYNLKEGLIAPGVAMPGLQINLENLRTRLDGVRKLLSINERELRMRQFEELRATFTRITTNPRLLQDIKALELIEVGISMLDSSGKCPLCLHEYDPGYLDKLLKERRNYARSARENLGVIQNTESLVNSTAAAIQIAIGDFLSAIRKAGLLDEEEQLSLFDEQVRKFSSQVNRSCSDYDLKYPQSSYVNLDMPEDLVERLEKIFSALENSATKIPPEQDAWDQLTKMEIYLTRLQQEKHELEMIGRQFAISQKLKEQYESARNDVLEDLFKDVCCRFTELYTELHKEDEGNFCAQLMPSGGSIDFRVDYMGHGDFPPHAIHSEGHQDSMGVCLFLALAERLTRNALNLILLDDVVMSVDIGHRRQLGNMLAKNFTNRQFLITTHDRVWATQLRNAGVVNSNGLVKLMGWTYDAGPLFSEITNLWDLIEKDLSEGDVSAASAKLRRGLEEFSTHSCDALQAKVRFALDGRWELGDLMQPVIHQYKELLGKAKASANSWNRVDIRTQLSNLEKDSCRIIAFKDIEQWSINSTVHYNTWAELSPDEFRVVVNAHKDLVNLFYCQNCESLIFLVEEEKKPVNVRCQCGDFNWNLVEKPKK